MHLTNDVDEAAQALAAGHLVAVPTETVYGLGARADLAESVARVYATKGRPADHPLIVHVNDAAAAWAWASAKPAYAEELAAAYWPGPLTLVLPRSPKAGDFITGGQDTVALRVPAHPTMRALLARVIEITGDPTIGIAAPSANRFGRVSPTTAQHVLDELQDFAGPKDLVLEGGVSDVGVESTIVDCTKEQPILLRPGQVSAADIEATTALTLGTKTTVRAPGMLESHYAPRARVRIVDELTARQPEGIDDSPTSESPTTGLLALAHVETPQGMVRLSAPVDADEYAQVLYAALREADALGLHRVIAVPPGPEGIGAAVRDRLQRAAT